MTPVRLVLLLIPIAVLAQLPTPKIMRPAPEQPVPYSHKTHVAMGLKCAQCHPMPEPGDFMTLPATKVCMGCHASVKKDSPHIAKVAAAHAESGKMKWAPVYRVPDYVFFSHKGHLKVADVNCETCHGPVATRDVMRREKDISMQGCMECHRVKGASNDCKFCHDQR